MKKILDKKIINICLSFLIIFLGVFIICKYNMFAQDEYNYSNIAWTNERLSNMKDVIHSMIDVYTSWSGRIIVLGIEQTILCYGKFIYDIINPLVLILFIIFVLKNANMKISPLGIFSVLFLMVFGAYKFWEKYIWISGSINYLWTVTASLIMMYLLKKLLKNSESGKLINNIVDTLILFVVSLFTGLSHENTAFVMGAYIIFICIFNYKKIFKLEKRKLVTLIISIFLFGIGAMVLIFCPGNFNRMNGIKRNISILCVLKNILALYKVLIIYGISIILMKKNKVKIKEILNINTEEVLIDEIKYYICPIVLAVLPMIIIAEFPVRAALAYETMLYIIIIRNFGILYKIYSNKKTKIVYFFIVGISIVLVYSKAVFAFFYLRPYSIEMVKEIELQKMQKKENIVVPKFEHENIAKIFGVYMDIFPENIEFSIINTYMCNYYNISSIRAVRDGYVQIEIDVENDENMYDYVALDKRNGEVITSRITKAHMIMPNESFVNKIIFEVPKEKIEYMYIYLPNQIKDTIKEVNIYTIHDDIFDFDVKEIFESNIK